MRAAISTSVRHGAGASFLASIGNITGAWSVAAGCNGLSGARMGALQLAMSRSRRRLHCWIGHAWATPVACICPRGEKIFRESCGLGGA